MKVESIAEQLFFTMVLLEARGKVDYLSDFARHLTSHPL